MFVYNSLRAMKVNFVHKIPDSVIIFTISIGIVILIVYGLATNNSLKGQLETMRLQQIERTEEILKRAREERQIDMMSFFTTNKISCSCEE